MGSPHDASASGASTAALKACRSRSVTYQESSGTPGTRRRRGEGEAPGSPEEEEGEPAADAPSLGGRKKPPRGSRTKFQAARRMREKVPLTVSAHQSSRTSAKPWKARATRCFDLIIFFSPGFFVFEGE